MRDIHCYSRHSLLYANPYMVVTPRGYTKHYYNGSQRIAARIGGYWHDESVFVSSPALTNTAESLWAATLYKEELREQETPFDEVYVSPVGVFLPVAQYGPVVANLSGMHADDLLSSVFSGHNSEQLDYDTVGIYFYHSDHLGSSSWITDDRGQVVQYLHYMPFGELWENQQLSEYDERFKFTGKERDTETGYDYFGARYYASALPMWLSVDPLADKYPGINPYAYCTWNPIKYVDPDGKKIVIGTWYGRVLAKLGVHNFEYKVMNQLKSLKSMNSNLNDMINDLEDSSIKFYIKYEDSKHNHYNRKTKTIRYNPDSNIRPDGESRPPEAALAHELGHAENDKNNTSVDYNSKAAEKGDQKELGKKNLNEVNSIYYENIVREYEGYPQRGYNYVNGD